MKLKETFSLVLCVLLLSGCAANFSTEKYVEGNTFVSERMPTVEIQASSEFTLADTNSGDRTQGLVSDFGTHDSFGMKRFEAHYFNEKNPNILLKIKTEYTTKSGWSLGGPNFKNWPGVKIILADQQIKGLVPLGSVAN